MDTAAPDTASRQAWLRTLAQADAAQLAARADPVLADYAFETLRAPEAGLVLLRARIAGDGDRFNLGEATVVRCVMRHRAAPGREFAGVGTVLGRDGARASRIACLDALMQRAELRPLLQAAVLQPLAEDTGRRRAAERATAEATRVRFFTLQPEQTA